MPTTLDFDRIQERMEGLGVLTAPGPQVGVCGTTYKTIGFPCDKGYKFGSILLLQFYNCEEDFYFIYIAEDEFAICDKEIDKEDYIYKIDVRTGKVSEGRGLITFEKYLDQKKIPKSAKKLLELIEFEARQTVISNSASFVLSL